MVEINNDLNINLSDSDAKEKLKSIVEVIAIDIYRSEEAYYLYKEIGENAERINKKGYGGLFNSIQESLKLQLIIRTTRIFEKPKRYTINSIPYALIFIETNKTKLDIFNRLEFKKALSRLGMKVDSILGLHYVEFNERCIKYLTKILPNPVPIEMNELWISLYKTKWQRDKVFVHNEILDENNQITPTFKDLQNLIALAKNYVMAFGWGYLSMAYGTGDDYFLSYESNFASRQMKDLLKIANIV